MEVGKRIFGLDVMRALAIVLVMLAHTYEFIWPSCPYNLNKLFGYLGVEIFFVLSGFLIGRILIKLFETSSTIQLSDIFHFWKRRWYRTLPNYFLCLILYILFHYWMNIPLDLSGIELASYFVFLQNSIQPHPGFFAIAWSLSIEEWFYLSAPLIMWFFWLRTKKPKNAIIGSLTLLILGSLTLRIGLTYMGDLNWGSWYRKMIFWRLDGIAMGVLFAWLYLHNSWDIKAAKNKLFLYGFIMSFLLLIPFWQVYVIRDESNFFLNTSFFTFMSLALAMTLPLFAQWRTRMVSFSEKAVEWMSKISYSLYLIHWMVVLFFHHQTQVDNTIKFVGIWVVSLVLSHVIYRYYEVRMTALRDR